MKNKLGNVLWTFKGGSVMEIGKALEIVFDQAKERIESTKDLVQQDFPGQYEDMRDALNTVEDFIVNHFGE
jgi:hypothetical protein